jgi:hypothetical protein
MKTYICDKVERIGASRVKSVINGVVTFIDDSLSFKAIPEIINAELTESQAMGNQGKVVTQKLTVNAGLPLSDYKDITGEPQVFRLTLSTGNTQVFGDNDRPVKLSTAKREIKATELIWQRLNPESEF